MKAFAPLLAAAAARASLAFAQDPPGRGTSAPPDADRQRSVGGAALPAAGRGEGRCCPPGSWRCSTPPSPTAPPPPGARGAARPPLHAGGPGAVLRRGQAARRPRRPSTAASTPAPARCWRRQGDSLPVRYLRALAAVRAGDDARAAAEMTALAEDYPPLRDRCLTHAGARARGRSAASTRRPRCSPRCARTRRLYADARLALARVLRKTKDPDGARWPRSRPSPAAPRPRGAATWAPRRSWPAPTSPPRSKDRAARARLPLDAVGLAPAVAPGEAGREAPQGPAGASGRRRWRAASSSSRRTATSQGIGGARAAAAHAQAAGRARLPRPLRLRQGRCARSASTRAPSPRSTPVVDKCQDRDLLPRALYVLGSSRSIVDQAAGPRDVRAAGAGVPGPLLRGRRALLRRGPVREDGPARAGARAARGAGAALPPGRLPRRGALQGRSGSAARRRSRTAALAAARARSSSASRDADETYDVERARYWRARTLQDSGDAQERRGPLRAARGGAPGHLLRADGAHELSELEPARLRARGAPARLHRSRSAASPGPCTPGRWAKDPHFLAGVELLRLGFPEAVSSELLAVEPHEPARRDHAAAGAPARRSPGTSARRTRWRAWRCGGT